MWEESAGRFADCWAQFKTGKKVQTLALQIAVSLKQ
jgi:hypothetical protein